MGKTYLFYDLETTELFPKYCHQIIQVALVLTDENFAVIKRRNIKVKLSSDVAPAPMALLTNYISVKDITRVVSDVQAKVEKFDAVPTATDVLEEYMTENFLKFFCQFESKRIKYLHFRRGASTFR